MLYPSIAIVEQSFRDVISERSEHSLLYVITIPLLGLVRWCCPPTFRSSMLSRSTAKLEHALLDVISERNEVRIFTLLDRSDERRCGSQQIDRTDEKIDINNWTVRTYLDRSVDAQISKHKHRNKRIFWDLPIKKVNLIQTRWLYHGKRHTFFTMICTVANIQGVFTKYKWK